MSDRLVIIDTETTGLIPGHHVPLSIAAVDVSSLAYRYYEIEWPNALVCPEAIKVNHWDFAKQGRLCPCEAARQFKDWLLSINQYNKDRVIAVGRNPVFDKQMIEMAFPDIKWPIHHRVLDLHSVYHVFDLSGKIVNAAETITTQAAERLAKSHPDIHAYGGHHALFDAWRAFHELEICVEYMGL